MSVYHFSDFMVELVLLFVLLLSKSRCGAVGSVQFEHQMWLFHHRMFRSEYAPVLEQLFFDGLVHRPQSHSATAKIIEIYI